MTPKLGYLLPTRERIMQGDPETGPMLDLAARAEALGFDSVWVGDSLLARPRHEPLILLAGVAGRVPRVSIGTAVLLPALRNPVVLAHLVATLDQVSEGRLILGVGFATDVPNIRAEFVAAFERLAQAATRAGAEGHTFRVHAPLLRLNKAEIIQDGLRRGIDYGLTVSCYQADSEGRACGKCDSCRIRRDGFLAAGIPDPTRYR